MTPEVTTYLHVVVSVEGFVADGTGEPSWSQHDLRRRGDPILMMMMVGLSRYCIAVCVIISWWSDVKSHRYVSIGICRSGTMTMLMCSCCLLAWWAESEEYGGLFSFVLLNSSAGNRS